MFLSTIQVLLGGSYPNSKVANTQNQSTNENVKYAKISLIFLKFRWHPNPIILGNVTVGLK